MKFYKILWHCKKSAKFNHTVRRALPCKTFSQCHYLW